LLDDLDRTVGAPRRAVQRVRRAIIVGILDSLDQKLDLGDVGTTDAMTFAMTAMIIRACDGDKPKLKPADERRRDKRDKEDNSLEE
jgi:hypothetical protein